MARALRRAATQRAFEPEAWAKQLASVPLLKSDLNALVLDYLVTEGFAEAAAAFAADVRAPARVEVALIDARTAAVAALRAGRAAAGAALLEASFPGILDGRPGLGFTLRVHALVEKILAKDLDGALALASPLSEEADGDSVRTAELERALALLAYEHPEGSPFAAVLSPAARAAVAADANAAALEAAGRSPSPRLPALLRALLASSAQLAAEATFPTAEAEVPQLRA